ncbi:MAG TPA: HAMP domain-containing sensor histidine kinase [Chitinophagaceae bacterium]|nr:HAMP domain-containing sensor histidine kinase [Chitinophagaceae bacterium]
MKKIIAIRFLMLATILVIVSFQAYWLKDNYTREKRLLESKAGIIFRTKLFELQTKKLNLNLISKTDTTPKNVNFYFRSEEGEAVYVKRSTKEQLVGIGDVLRTQMKDSAKNHKHGAAKVFVSVNKPPRLYDRDSLKATVLEKNDSGKDKIFQILYGIDSLQDSLKIDDIRKELGNAFKNERLDISFQITRVTSADSKKDDTLSIPIPPSARDELKTNEVTIGFAHPLTYTMELGGNSVYILKKILSPLLFSIFLVGVTITSFLVLYRNLNRQRRLTEIKNEFIGNITHELKTPISTVSVAIEAMKNFNALQNPERTREYLDIADNELQRLGLLVDKVLKLSMFEKQQVELKQEWFDIKKLMEEIINSMKIQFEKHQASITLKTEGNDFMIMADRLHIMSVVYNLLDNSLKYSKNKPVIDVIVTQAENAFVLKVNDNGMGIPDAYKDKIFDKFFRVPSGDRHNVKGYGLGLSYVAHIVQQHHGTINVWSEEGKGTQFTIQLPKEYGQG